MSTRTVLIEPRDPVIFRDGKPSLAGLPIRSMEWPMPSAIAGAIRTRLGRGTGYDPDTVKRLLKVRHVGPLPVVRVGDSWELAVPAPADVKVFRDGDRLSLEPLRPATLRAGDGTDSPAQLPPALMKNVTGDESYRGKAYEDLKFWRVSRALSWLSHAGSETVETTLSQLGYERLESQRRIHLEVEDSTQAAKDGALFSTESLEFTNRPERDVHRLDQVQRVAICSRVECDEDDWAHLPGLAPLGGERRLAHWWEEEIEWPKRPEKRLEGLVRMQLLTPAYFEEGWKPDWLSRGAPDGIDGVELKLVSAAIPRAVAHSGWDLAKQRREKHPEDGAKATRFLVPAGSVYFFEASGDARELWLRSISEGEREPNEGFGLVLVGEWKWLSDYC